MARYTLYLNENRQDLLMQNSRIYRRTFQLHSQASIILCVSKNKNLSEL